MASTGNVYPTVGESVDRSGLTAWTNPGNIVSDNTTDATCNAAGSDYLVARAFSFSVPYGSTILGITVRVEASEHSTNTEVLYLQLQGSDSALIGVDGSVTVSGTTKAVYTQGAVDDLWSATLTSDIVNSANFGVRLWFATSHDVRIDYVTMAIEYTPGVRPQTRLSLLGVS